MSLRPIGLLAGVAIAGCVYRTPPTAVTRTGAEQEAQLELVFKLGTLIYEQDQAAWVATDLLFKTQKISPGIRGWVATRTASQWEVDFVDREDRVAMRVDIEPFKRRSEARPRLEVFDDRPPLEPLRAAAFAARQTAAAE